MCLSLSVADWMQQVELWGYCRALGNHRGRRTAALQRLEFKSTAPNSALSFLLCCFSVVGLRTCYDIKHFFIAYFSLLLQFLASVFLFRPPPLRPIDIQQRDSELRSQTLPSFDHSGEKASHGFQNRLTNCQKTSRNSTTVGSHTLTSAPPHFISLSPY